MNNSNPKLAAGHIRKTISDYNLIAGKFSSTRLNITTDLQKLAASLPQDAKVLDYGCGNGRMAELFDADKYLGVDPSSELIKIAKQLHPQHNFRLIEAGERVDEKFDAVLCLAVIHHLPDHASHQQLLNILSSSLNKEGTLILTAWNLENEQISPDGLVHKPFTSDSTTIDRALYPFTLDELTNVLKAKGFNVISATSSPRNRGAYSNLEIQAQLITR